MPDITIYNGEEIDLTAFATLFDAEANEFTGSRCGGGQVYAAVADNERRGIFDWQGVRI
jgi:hypothetical protein